MTYNNWKKTSSDWKYHIAISTSTDLLLRRIPRLTLLYNSENICTLIVNAQSNIIYAPRFSDSTAWMTNSNAMYSIYKPSFALWIALTIKLHNYLCFRKLNIKCTSLLKSLPWSLKKERGAPCLKMSLSRQTATSGPDFLFNG